MLKIYRYDLTEDLPFDDKFRARSIALVPKGRREYIRSLKSLKDRDRALAAYLLIVNGLAEITGEDLWPDVIHEEDNAPVLEPPVLLNGVPLNVSITHSDDVIAVAISDLPVGIDITPVKRSVRDSAMRERVLNRFLHPKDQEKINNSEDPARAFAKFIGLKEALAKQNRTSLIRELKKTRDLNQE